MLTNQIVSSSLLGVAVINILKEKTRINLLIAANPIELLLSYRRPNCSQIQSSLNRTHMGVRVELDIYDICITPRALTVTIGVIIITTVCLRSSCESSYLAFAYF
jgi:hypothetical protein